VGNYPECKRACGMALAFDPKCEKALFRRGQALLLQRFFKEAIEDFEAVLESNPSNEAAKQQIEQCHREIKAFKVKEREMYNSFLLRKKAEKVRLAFDILRTNRTILFFLSSSLTISKQQ
jgi:tetratricopeptide (TPR) repeat protein